MLRCSIGRPPAFAAYMHCHDVRSVQSSVLLREAQLACGEALRWGHSAAIRGRRQVEVCAERRAPSLDSFPSSLLCVSWQQHFDGNQHSTGDIIGSSVARFCRSAQQHSIKRFHSSLTERSPPRASSCSHVSDVTSGGQRTARNLSVRPDEHTALFESNTPPHNTQTSPSHAFRLQR